MNADPLQIFVTAGLRSYPGCAGILCQLPPVWTWIPLLWHQGSRTRCRPPSPSCPCSYRCEVWALTQVQMESTSLTSILPMCKSLSSTYPWLEKVPGTRERKPSPEMGMERRKLISVYTLYESHGRRSSSVALVSDP